MKTRLNKKTRGLLVTHAVNTIKPEKEIVAEEKAYQAMLDELTIQYCHTYPPEDLKVLNKHECLKERRCVLFYVTHKDRNTESRSVDLRDGDGFKLVRRSTFRDSEVCTVTNRSKLVKLVKAWEKAEEALNDAKQAIRRDMVALINTSRTFEDVITVWEGAEELRDQVCAKNYALSTLDTGTIQRIKKLTSTK